MGGPWLAALTVSEGHWQAMFWALLLLACIVALLTIIYAPKMELPRETWSSSSFLLFFVRAFFILYTLFAAALLL